MPAHDAYVTCVECGQDCAVPARSVVIAAGLRPSWSAGIALFTSPCCSAPTSVPIDAVHIHALLCLGAQTLTEAAETLAGDIAVYLAAVGDP